MSTCSRSRVEPESVPSAGTGRARRPVLTGADRWALLGMGVYLFVVMFPAVLGPMAAGRIAIGIWMLMFAGLGLSLMRGDGEVRP
jgi:hypothetical protein